MCSRMLCNSPPAKCIVRQLCNAGPSVEMLKYQVDLPTGLFAVSSLCPTRGMQKYAIRRLWRRVRRESVSMGSEGLSHTSAGEMTEWKIMWMLLIRGHFTSLELKENWHQHPTPMNEEVCIFVLCRTECALVTACLVWTTAKITRQVFPSSVLVIIFSSGAAERCRQVTWTRRVCKRRLRKMINTARHHKIQLVQSGFGTSVVKVLEAEPCDGAWYVKNAALKPMHSTTKKSYEAAPCSQIDFGLSLLRSQCLSGVCWQHDLCSAPGYTE